MASSRNTLKYLSRVAATLALVALAAVAAWFAWQHYVYAPWTRDARVQANVINIAPNVAGTVVKVAVSDDSRVQKGDLLFKIDPTRFKLAVNRAKATVAKAKSQAAYDRKNAQRLAHLPSGAVSTQKVQLARAKAKSSAASVTHAKAKLAVAKQNLDWTTVRSPVNGFVTHLLLNQGDYAKQGQRVFTLVDASTFRVTAYFEETKLDDIDVGDPARITLMARDGSIAGHVKSIARGIAVSNNAAGERNLPNVDPTFQWVRLAQRVPVTIAFDHPQDVGRLTVGLTATIRIQDDDESLSDNSEASPHQ